MQISMRHLVIDDWQNEAYDPHQQFYKQLWGAIMGLAKAILGWLAAGPNEWFLVLTHVMCIHDLAAVKSLGCMIQGCRMPSTSHPTSSSFLMLQLQVV